jgi:type IV pilus assembly protein PilB
MVGEIRDAETAMIAVKAATTGHLVLSTLHTNDAAGAITRLIDMGVEPFLVASSLAGIISQRLVRTLCSKCKRSYLVEPGTPEGDFLGLTAGRTFTAYAPAGCSQCAKIGYRGRIGIQEVLPVTPAIRQMAKQRASEQEIKSQARLEGMLTMREDGIEKVRAGITSVKEIMRVVFSEEEN